MKILYSLHMFPPFKNCGSETYAFNLLKYLQSQGHEVRVLYIPAPNIPHPKTSYVYNGIEVFPGGAASDVLIRWADRVITHLWPTSWTVQMCKIYKRPVYHVTHGEERKELVSSGRYPVNIIYNAYHIANKLNYPRHPSIVLHPVIKPEYYQTGVNPEEANYITLVNLNKNKGVELFYGLAERFPNKKFLGVTGSYDQQIIREDLPNVKIISQTTDILSVYRHTRILLAPSQLESFGMAAREAMCSGIPVIANPTDGLLENCGEAAMYCNRENIEAWSAGIDALDEKNYYLYRSELSKKRAYNSELPGQLKNLEKFLNVSRC